MTTTVLETAIASTRAVLVQADPSQYALPTPCASWDVQHLVDHLVSEAPAYFLSVCNGDTPASGSTMVPAAEALALYDARYRDVVEAFGRPDLLETNLTAEFGEIPAMAFLGIATNDVFVHGWDLAKALGLPTDLSPGVAEHLLEFTGFAVSDAFRGPEGALFGAEQQAPVDASPADRLAAFLGRTV